MNTVSSFYNSYFIFVNCLVCKLSFHSNKWYHEFLQAFKDLGVPYDVYELDKNKDGTEVQDVLDNMTGSRTVSIY